MARGSFYLGASGVKEFAEAVREVAGDLDQMTGVFSDIAAIAERDVMRHAPVGMPSRKDSRGHLPPGSLRNSIHGRATATSARVEVKWDGPLMLQEFGGASIWRTGGGAVWHRGGKYGRSRSSGFFTTDYKSHKVRSHKIYTKPRNTRGYFIWNVVWRLRMVIPQMLTEGIVKIADKHGLVVEVASDYGLSPQFEARSDPSRPSGSIGGSHHAT